MSVTTTTWESNSPASLLTITARYCITHPNIFKEEDILPLEIGERLLQIACEEGVNIDDKCADIFRYFSMMGRAFIKESTITDRGMELLLRHRLHHLDIHNCQALTGDTLSCINQCCENLRSLSIGNCGKVLPDYLKPVGGKEETTVHEYLYPDDNCPGDKCPGNIFEKQGFIIKTPKLKKLCIIDLFIYHGLMYFDLLLKPLPDLCCLDLTGAKHRQGMDNFQWLLHCRKLTSLTLHNVQEVETSLPALCQLQHLQHLDISQCRESLGHFKQPTTFLHTLVTSIHSILSLDISGTNLGGAGGDRVDKEGLFCDIPGLVERINQPLEFLGLYKTQHEASGRQYIPAKSISGDTSEEQILLAGQKYLERPSVLHNVLNDLFVVLRYKTWNNLKQALDICLLAMDRYVDEKHIQISGSASLYYLVKTERLRKDWNLKMKRKVLSTLMTAMLAHKDDPTLLRNGCLIICLFRVPTDILFDYQRLAEILLHIIHTNEADTFTQQSAMLLLNSMAGQVEDKQKQLLGSMGAVEKLLSRITEKLEQGVCDAVMEFGWSAIWNITDSVTDNCQVFVNNGGIQLFMRCKERFLGNLELMRNMVGVLGNVAETPSLRNNLMTKDIMEEFGFLLRSNDPEISFYAGGVLANMTSQGEAVWDIEYPSRNNILTSLGEVITTWDLELDKSINYRSLSPILHLAKVDHTVQCQLWAVWAMANLTTVMPEEYCRMVVEEGGLTVVEDIIDNHHHKQLRSLAETVRSNVVRWKKERGAVRPSIISSCTICCASASA